ncbi:MAG: ABC transporter substrate-binding protein [Herpetosiphon sp.]
MASGMTAGATMASGMTAGATSAAASGTAAASGMTATAGNLDALIAAAKKEGTLTLIALPDDWSNYGEIKKSFEQKYGIKVTTLNPDGSSQEELEAIKANKDNKGPQAPDTVEVGLAFGPSAKTDGLIQPYKVSTWDSIPAELKDADGAYYGDYYGVMAMLVNKDVVKNVPQDWNDLLKPEYKSQVALSGDPRGSNQAIQSVQAAALGTGGSLDNAQAGLDFFAKLNQQGNLVPIIAKQASFAKGETPIQLTWDYLALAARDALKGNPQVEVVLPKSGLYAGMYVQAISAYAPHPNAAKLWMEYLYSDEGSLLWLKGYVRPVRYDDMVKRKVIPAEISSKLPPAENYAKAVFPKPEQLDKAKKLITGSWDTVVKADIKKAP